VNKEATKKLRILMHSHNKLKKMLKNFHFKVNPSLPFLPENKVCEFEMAKKFVVVVVAVFMTASKKTKTTRQKCSTTTNFPPNFSTIVIKTKKL
jgi:hypothetical protein